MRFEDLLSKPIWQMTGEEFLFLQQNAARREDTDKKEEVVDAQTKRYEYGIRGIAKVFGCSIPTANRIKKSGRIDRAISQVGRKIIIDADLALQLAHCGTHGKKGGRV